MNKRQQWKTGNSKTYIEMPEQWLVLDLGSGHQPHARADILLDRYFEEHDSRSGAKATIEPGRMVCADALHMPFRDKAFDFVIASHIAEHIPNPDTFCKEMIRVGKSGYLETPSKFTEVTRGAPYHLWYVTAIKQGLLFEKAEQRMQPEWLGRLYYHLSNFGRPWMKSSRLNVSNPFLRVLFRGVGFLCRRIPILISKDLVYTRFRWEDSFAVIVEDDGLE